MFAALFLSSQLVLSFAPPPAANIACPCNKDFSPEVSVPRFDPALGTLTGVEIRVVVQEPLYAGAAVLAENPTNKTILDPEASVGAVFVMRFASDNEWIVGAAEAWWWGSLVGNRNTPFGDSAMRGRTLAPFDGGLDWLGASAGGVCFPPCGPLQPGVVVRDAQLGRFIGTDPIKLLWQPRLSWWQNRAADPLRWAKSLPIQPYWAEVRYTYEAAQ